MNHESLDRLGASASLICGIHCFITPILLMIIPFASIAWLADERLELIFISCSCILALCSICYGYIKHRRSNVLSIMSLGFVCIVIARHYHENLFGAFLMGVGGMQLCLCHYLNIKFCEACKKCSHDRLVEIKGLHHG